jgi:hypothetical protein
VIITAELVERACAALLAGEKPGDIKVAATIDHLRRKIPDAIADFEGCKARMIQEGDPCAKLADEESRHRCLSGRILRAALEKEYNLQGLRIGLSGLVWQGCETEMKGDTCGPEPSAECAAKAEATCGKLREAVESGDAKLCPSADAKTAPKGSRQADRIKICNALAAGKKEQCPPGDQACAGFSTLLRLVIDHGGLDTARGKLPSDDMRAEFDDLVGKSPSCAAFEAQLRKACAAEKKAPGKPAAKR